MGAGARLAEERDRWPVDWQVADLDQEGEHLLDLLAGAEELRAAVPALRIACGSDGAAAPASVLIGVTNRRVLVVGRWPVADTDQRPHEDRFDCRGRLTSVAADVRRHDDGPRLVLPGDDAELELDPSSLERVSAHLDTIGTCRCG